MGVMGRTWESPLGFYFRVLMFPLTYELLSEVIEIPVTNLVGSSTMGLLYYSVKSTLMLVAIVPLLYFLFLRRALQTRNMDQRANIIEQGYQSIFENNPDGIYYMSLEGKFLTANESFTKMVGRSLEELMNISPLAIVEPRDISGARFHFLKSITRQVQTYEISLVHTNGQLIHVHVTNIPMAINGKVEGVYAILRDITRCRQAESALTEKTEQLESFIQNNNDSILIFDGAIQRVNTAFEQMYGWGASEVIGHQLPFVPDGRDDEVNEIIDQVQRGKLVKAFETVRRRKDGKLMDISLTVSPIRKSDGSIVAFSAVSRDITAQKLAHRELLETKEMLESFISHTTDAILVQDLDGNILRVNSAYEKMFGWSANANELVGGSELPVPDFLMAEYRQNLQIVAEGGTISGAETVRCKKDGKLINVSVSLSPIRDSLGNVVAVSAIKRDITERKKIEERMLQVEKLRVAGQLAAGIGHELRNPMTAVKGFIQLLHVQNSGQNEYLKIVTDELNHMDAILNEFLLLAKPKPKHLQMNNVSVLLHETVELMQTQAIMSNTKIIIQQEVGIGMIQCDESQIKQVFVNVLKNSIEAMRTGGDIEVRTIQMEDQVVIRIRDYGEGIPEEILRKIGEPFYTTKEKGTGLGLSICRKIIEEHSGKLTLHSTLGKGTLVEIYFPLFIPIIGSSEWDVGSNEHDTDSQIQC